MAIAVAIAVVFHFRACTLTIHARDLFHFHMFCIQSDGANLCNKKLAGSPDIRIGLAEATDTTLCSFLAREVASMGVIEVAREPIVVDCAILPEVIPSLFTLREFNAVHDVPEAVSVICDFVLVLHIEIIGYPWADVNINLGFFSVVSCCR